MLKKSKPVIGSMACLPVLIALLCFYGCMGLETQTNGNSMKTVYEPRTKFVKGGDPVAYSSIISGIDALALKMVEAMIKNSQTNHRYALTFAEKQDLQQDNPFMDFVAERLTVSLNKTGEIQIAADAQTMKMVLQEMVRQNHDIYSKQFRIKAGEAHGATALVMMSAHFMPHDKYIVVSATAVDIKTSLPLPGISEEILLDYSGDTKDSWDESNSEQHNLDFQIQLLAKKRLSRGNQLISVTPNTKLSEGDGVKLWVKSQSPCYLYVVNRDADGNCTCLFPRDDIKELRNPLPADVDAYLPPEQDVFYIIDSEGRHGQEEIWWAVSREPDSSIENLMNKIRTGHTDNGYRDLWMLNSRGMAPDKMKANLKKGETFHIDSFHQDLLIYHFDYSKNIQGSIFSFYHE